MIKLFACDPFTGFQVRMGSEITWLAIIQINTHVVSIIILVKKPVTVSKKPEHL